MPTPQAFAPIGLADLTTANTDGTGVFDVLMQSLKLHLQQEFDLNRIKGSEFSTVYLGALQASMATSLQFLVQRQASNQEALIKEKQLALMDAQLANLQKEGDNLLVQKAILEAQAQQIAAQTALLGAQKLQSDADTALTAQKTDNALIEKGVLIAQKCKLQAEFDVLMLTKDKTVSETALLSQKIVTERAQITALGVDADSVVGRQKQLFAAQTAGFARDAEQKAAKLLIDSWNVRRTTDEGTSANSTNNLDDSAVGRAVTAMLAGIGA